MTSSSHEPDDTLITPASLALSLAPPRAPPHFSSHRALLNGKNPLRYAPLSSKQEIHHDTQTHLHRLWSQMNATHYIPHPHLDNLPNIGDRITRLLGSVLPLSVQHHLRDNGTFRSVADSAVTMGVPVLAASNPSVAKKFLALSQEKIRWKYGSHDMQLVDFFLPKGSDGTVTSNPRGILFFVVSL